MKVHNPTETKRHSSLKIGVVEDVAVEDVMVVEVTRITISKEDSRANKIGVVEDVDKEVVGRTTPMSNVTNVTSRGTMRRTVTPTVVTTVEKWDILQ